LDARDPQEQLIKAVADNTIDVAIAWGPTAGYYARKSTTPLDVATVSADSTHPDLPFSFAISVGVRKGNWELKRELDAALRHKRKAIAQLLRAYGFPDARFAANSPVQEVD
jgi:ABC-type amino acid transport substrate-binding protein